MGRISVATVHSAEMPITPAPRKRALLLHNCSASALSVCPSANVDEAISHGTTTAQHSTKPSSVAMPAAAPMR